MDCASCDRIGRFWRLALPYGQDEPTAEDVQEALRLHPEWATMAIVQDRAGRHPRLRFEEVPEPKHQRDRVRWELGLPAGDFNAEVARLIKLGATGEPPTLGHPAGNDFDVVPVEGDRRFLGIIIEALDVDRVAAFWGEVLRGVPDIGSMPELRFVGTEQPKQGKNRMHLDLFCRDPAEIPDERHRVAALGARFEDAATGHMGMFDPEGNEFCLH
jgi:hypothetical protein